MANLSRISQARRTEISDARMLDAAVELIVERGPDKTTLKDVGELAGYSRGLAGYRFGNKGGLFTFVIQEVGKQWLEAFKQAVGDATGRDAINACVDAHTQFCVEMPKPFMAFYLLWFESIGPQSEVKDIIASIHARRCEDVAGWIQAGLDDGSIKKSVDPQELAVEFCTTVIGIVYQWLLNPYSMERTVPLYDSLKAVMDKRIGGD